MKRSIIVIAALLAAALLASCRDEEQHPLVMGNGNYAGPADNQLTAKQLSEIDSRVALQGTANETGGAARRPTEERPAPATPAALEKRLQEQAGPQTPKAPTTAKAK